MKQPSTNSDRHPPSFWLTIALLSAVTVPQLGLGLSTPATAALAGDLGVSVAAAQGTMVIYMMGYAVSMVLAGLLSDRFGARSVQIWGLVLAAAAALLAAAAPDFLCFSIARCAQALGGCVGTVTTRLIVKDEYPESDRMKILTTLSSAIAVTPCIAPLLGGTLVPYLGWRGIFVVIAVVSFVVMCCFAAVTRGVVTPQKSVLKTRQILTIYGRNLLNTKFRFYAAAISLVWMSYFAFVSCSSYPMLVHQGLSAAAYGVLLATSAIGYVSGSTTARLLSRRMDIDIILRLAAVIGCCGGMLNIVVPMLVHTVILSVAAPMVVVLFAAGMVIPATQAGLLRSITQDPGVSSGQFFFFQMIAGALYAALGNFWPHMTPQVLGSLVALPMFLLGGLLVMDVISSRVLASRG